MNPKDLRKKMQQLESVAGISSLLKEIGKLNTAGREIIIQALSSEMSNAKKQQFIAQLRSEAVKADTAVKEWVAKGIGNAYVSGVNIGTEMVKSSKSVKIATDGQFMGKVTLQVLTQNKILQPHLDAVNTLLSDAYLDFGSGINSFVKGGERILNDQLKRQVRSTIAQGRLDGAGINEIKKTVKEVFSDKGFTVLLDKSGRQWELQNYSEMLARTHVIKANNEGVINRAGDFGIDIVEISAHASPCDVCSKEEGKIYSISGKSKNYKALAGHEPPFHPRCKHTLMLRPDLQ